MAFWDLSKDVPSDSDTSTPEEIVVEINGDGVHLHTVASAAVLKFLGEYLDLLEQIATETHGECLRFSGLRAFEKCASFVVIPSDPELARQAVLMADDLLARREHPGHGLGGPVVRVQEARRGLPADYHATVRMRGLERSITVDASPSKGTRPFAMTSLRAYLVRIGGSRPRATFQSKSEQRPFTLDLPDRQHASRLSPYLYDWIDIVAFVGRDDAGNIDEGELREFYPLSDEDPWTALCDWYRDSGQKPESVD